MMIVKVKATNVLQRTIEAEKEYKILCHEGGSRSSKTWSIFQFFILKAMAGEKLVITVARKNLTWIKSTLLVDFKQILEEYGLATDPPINPNRHEQTYMLNGTEFSFFGLDYPQKLHGRSQDWFWLNEAIETSLQEFDQLEMRTRIGGIIDYNPSTDRHWVYDIQKREDVALIKSTMLDNPFLPDSIISKIKSYEPTPDNIKNGTANEYMWEVYGKGNKARQIGAIFENYGVVDELPKEAKLLGYGLDFGFTNDQTGLVALYRFNDALYFDELIYQTNLTNQDISRELKRLEVIKDIWADSAEPKSIEELRRLGHRIQPVSKGSDSIKYGIDLMKSKKIFITKRSVNLDSEFRKYVWATDKDGNATNKPIDNFNHLIDACRYVTMSTLKARTEFVPIRNY